jgi:hypothetical protein
VSGLSFKPCGHAVGFQCICPPTASAPPGEPQLDFDAFSAVMARVERLRTARAEQIALRDRVAWESIRHTACRIGLLLETSSHNSLFKRQAE